MNLLTQNRKLKKTSEKSGKRVFNFGIPAYKTQSGKLTCPMASECVKFCYASKGAYIWSNVKPAFERRYEATRQENFPELMTNEIKKKKADFIRVHDSGDYYSKAYLKKWFQIAKENPKVKFYSYTNMVKLIKESKIPENFDFIFSDSGKQKNIIRKEDRHTKIFQSESELKKAGFVNAMENDLKATKWFSNNHKIGLIYH